MKPLAFLLLCSLALAEHARVIFDTDMANDCDDTGALAVLHALADRGEAEILAVVTNRKDPSNASAAACAAINGYYGRPDIPIGTDKDGAKTKSRTPSSFTPACGMNFRIKPDRTIRCPTRSRCCDACSPRPQITASPTAPSAR